MCLLRFACVMLFASVLLISDSTFSQTYPIKIAIYNDDGVGTGDAAKFEACIPDTTKYHYTEVLGVDIRNGILNNFDMVLFPGGSGSGQAASLQTVGIDSVKSFVYRGGGYFGTCGGAYLASAAYSWSLRILNAAAVDGTHWNRGHGPVILNIKQEGKDFYGLSQDTLTIIYWQGPLMSPGSVDTLPAYAKLATFATEIVENGAIAGAMIGSTAFAQSCFGKGRVIIHSPHPEMTDGLDFMVRAAVEYAGNHSSFTKLATPFESVQWTAGTSQSVQWFSGNGSDEMTVNYSTNSGSTWTQLSSASVNSYTWVVPNTPSTSCKIRINSNNRSGIGDTVSFTILPPLPTITSASSGSWNTTSTWNGGAIPDSLHDVIISVGHTVTVSSAGYCKNILFGDATSYLALSANLYIYGNFNRYSTSANPFYTTKSLWTAGSKIVFSGTAAEQTITNLGTTSTVPYPFSLNEVIINKSQGKFTTGTGANLKISIGTSLEVVNGTFELGATDDMEGRNVANVSTYPTILIDSGAVFNMMGSGSYIRRGNYISEDGEKIGKMTIYGTAYLASSSTNNISFSNIEVGNGGILYIPTGRNWAANIFNPGTVTIRNGGIYRNGLSTTNIWYSNATTPTSFVLEDGGVFLTYSGSTIFPPNFTNNGTVRYAAGTFDQAVTDMNYSRLELSYTGGYKKNWTLAANRTISDSLEINNSAILALTAATGTTLTVNNLVRLTTGSIDNSNANVALTLASGSTISRLSGTITRAPVFAGTANLIYENSSALSTANEMPTVSSVLNNLSLNNTGTLKLTTSQVVNGIFTLNGNLNLNSQTLTLGSSTSAKGQLIHTSGNLTGAGTFTRWFDASNISAGSGLGKFPMGNTSAEASIYVSGTPSTGGTVSAQFTTATGTTNFDPALTESGATINKRHNMAWTLGTGNGLAGNSFALSLSAAAIYAQSAAYITNPSGLDIVATASLAPGTFAAGSGTNNNAFANRTSMTTSNLNNTFYIGSGSENALPVELQNFSSAVNGRNVKLTWLTATEVNCSKFNIERKKTSDSRWVCIGFVTANGNSNSPKSYNFSDNNAEYGKYSYRLNIVDNDASYKYSNILEVTVAMTNKFTLIQNYPNPFNPTTMIEYQLPQKVKVTLKIYNGLGREIETLIDAEQDAGHYNLPWNASRFSSGVYFYCLKAGNFTSTKKLIIMK